jgi:hypothetical protein
MEEYFAGEGPRAAVARVRKLGYCRVIVDSGGVGAAKGGGGGELGGRRGGNIAQ